MQRILKLFSEILHFSVEFIQQVWDCLLVASRHTNNQQNQQMKITLSQFAIDQICADDINQPSVKLKKGVNIISDDDARKICLRLEDSIPHLWHGSSRRALENKIYEIESQINRD